MGDQGLLGLRSRLPGRSTSTILSLRLSARKAAAGCLQPGTEETEVDEEEEPDDDVGSGSCLSCPYAGIAFDDHPATRIAYQGQRAAGQGKRVDDDTVPGGEARILGLADDVTGGTVALGSSSSWTYRKTQASFPNRFVMLRNIIRQIAEEPGIELLELEVKSLPQVPRCSYHMMDENTPCCYLMARFRAGRWMGAVLVGS